MWNPFKKETKEETLQKLSNSINDTLNSNELSYTEKVKVLKQAAEQLNNEMQQVLEDINNAKKI